MARLFTMKYLFFFLLSLLFGVISCIEPRPVYENPDGYDLNSPEKFFLSESLLEISGIAFHRDNLDSVWGVTDERGRIYGFRLGKKKTQPFKFGPQGDYEDMAIVQDKVFVLRSDGTLFAAFLDTDKKKSEEVMEYADMLPKGEYEGLHIDERNRLYILCKSCRKEDHYSLKGYIVQIKNNTPVQIGTFSIDSADIYSRVDHKKKFRPSGLAQHRLTKDWYVISSVNKMLLIADSAWKVKDVYPLNPSVFRQPEGIVFDTDHNLYISNEGDETRNPNILKFDFLDNPISKNIK